MLLLPSCMKEQFESEAPMVFEEGEVAFRVGSVQTKSGTVPASEVLDIATVNVAEGHTLYLQDEVTSLDDTRVGTKGTPAFTENVSLIPAYKTFTTVALDESGDLFYRGDAMTGQAFTYVEGSENIWKHNYGQNIWGSGLSDEHFTYFFMKMPASMTGVTMDDDTPYDVSDGSIHFSYVSPSDNTTTETIGEGDDAVTVTKNIDGQAQQDILFTSHKRTDKVNGETITFYHALTGVKFANYFNNDTSIPDNKTETLIRTVTISGLKSEGDCVVTPSTDANVKSATAVVWDPESLKGSATFIQSYDEAFAQYGSTYNLDEKLNTTAAQHNLNDANGSLTFWLIPQTLNSNVKIKVKFDIRVNGDITFKDQELEVSLGDILTEGGHGTWKAGELHTFTLRPEKVGVRIDDNMASATVKNNLRFTNTGNVDQYVRVYIIGNWVGKRVLDGNGNTSAESVLMGYKTADLTDHREVERWNDKDFTWQGGTVGGTKVFRKWYSPGNPDGYDYVPYGEFEGLPEMGTSSAPGADNGKNWLRHDKFYYYTESIGPGHDLPSTNPLFTSYTITTVPDFWIADNAGTRRKAEDVHFVMDIAVQAISVPLKENGTPMTYLEAWTQALNPTGAAGFNINDL